MPQPLCGLRVQMMIALRDESAPDAPKQSFERETVSIGRVEGNTLVLPVQHISSRHARIRFQGGLYLITDLGSTNGSAIEREGKRLLLGPKGEAEIALRDGDVLVLGDIDAPVRLQVSIALGGPAVGENTIVAARSRPQTVEVNQRALQGNQALAVLLRLVESVDTAADKSELFSRIADAALNGIAGAADVLVIIRSGDKEQKSRLDVRAEAHRGDGLCRQPATSICERVCKDGEALLFGQDADALPAETLIAQGVGSGIAAPLWLDKEVVGVLQINCPGGRAELGEEQLDLAVVLAHHAAAALERAELISALKRAEAQLREENSYLRRQAQPPVEMIAESPATKRALDELSRAAQADVTVLLAGETGTGKEVAARYLHDHSRRRDRLLVPVNCGALSETLLDSELFGHKKGAFTGATTDRKGVFEVAAGGTVFLDEVGETPAPLQVRLLRVLEESTIKRVGETIERPVDVRIVAASNRDLALMVKEGRFRQDLYYRLRVFPVKLPPLRERREDIAPLCHAFAPRHAAAMGKVIAGIDQSFIEALSRYDFPGNVRELVNEIERAVVRVDPGEALTADLLSEDVLASAPSRPKTSNDGRGLRERLADYERELIIACLAKNKGHRPSTAAELGLTRQGLAKKIERLGIG